MNTTLANDARSRMAEVLIVVFFLFFYLLPLGERPLTESDEPRYAEIPREMLASGDWVVPQLNGLRYFEKPPLAYWLNAASIGLLGQNALAVRLPGALATGLTALLLYQFALRLFGRRGAARWAALIYLSSLGVYAIGQAGIPDNPLTTLLTGGIMAFWCGVHSERRERWWVLAGALFGLAFLVKGFLAGVVPALVLLPWMLWRRAASQLVAGALWVCATAVLVILPWALLVHLREGDYWHYFIWVEHIQRFLSPASGQHAEPVYYFLLYLPLLFFPWITLLPAGLAGLKATLEQGEPKPDLRFLWLWLLMPFLFFSFSSGKLLTYILPCLPPLSLLLAYGLDRYLRAPNRPLFSAGVVINALVLLGAFGALVANVYFDAGSPLYPGSAAEVAWLPAAALLLAAAASGLAARGGSAPARMFAVAAALAPVLVVATLALPERLPQRRSPVVLLENYKAALPADGILIAEHAVARSMAWVFSRNDVYLLDRGEFAYGLSYPDARHRLLDAEKLERLLQQNAGRHPILMICKTPCADFADKGFPAAAQRSVYGNYEGRLLPAAGG